ncbi:MAG TPA: DUF2232 domain-containing protein [Ktedonobacteraceae bacterium]|nr:DUF2232 domain-containing protein [Ktedonobacteraceae bacterium]
MLRKLSAVEIAEGALLADIAIIFQLIATYLPVGSGIFQLLVPTIFTVLVLRRGFYTGMMGVCVAMFVTCMLIGLGAGAVMLLECGAGVFLGITMKYRMRHLLLIFLGVTCSAILVYAGTWFFAFLLGTNAQHFVIQFQKVYDTAIHAVNFAAPQIGLNGVWRHNLYPTVAQVASFMFTYWQVMLFVVYWVALWPIVILVYYITNVLVRLLGYKVRPFPGGKLERFLHALVRFLVKPLDTRQKGRRSHKLTRPGTPENSTRSINERSTVEV